MISRPETQFKTRHIGPSLTEQTEMLNLLHQSSLESLTKAAVPKGILLPAPLDLPEPCTESQVLTMQSEIADQNRKMRCFIGQGFHDCLTPAVIRRNILESPCWYTQYTPYQAEISQGRLEALLNFQTLVSDLTGLPVATASLLDEASAAAEAMQVCYRARSRSSIANRFLISDKCHPQTLAVVATRARFLGIETVVGPLSELQCDEFTFGALLQNPDTDGRIWDLAPICKGLHKAGAKVVVATDPLACAIYAPPGERGADIAVGTTQRLGMGMGWGGPHAAFISAKDELKRLLPGRIVGVARDKAGRPALRLALQTREQHIRRERATSNICTAQVLPAIVASMYAVYHGPTGLHSVAQQIATRASQLQAELVRTGCKVLGCHIFDTVKVLSSPNGDLGELWMEAQIKGLSLRRYPDGGLGISLNEATEEGDLDILLSLLGRTTSRSTSAHPLQELNPELRRSSPILTHPVFSSYHSETEMLRYIVALQRKDLSLADAMIPLGSCTMKLNAVAELEPITWSGFANVHPYEPASNVQGYRRLSTELSEWLAAITGLPGVSLQPNAGSQGEYAGLLTIRSFHVARGETHRDICLIPSSAHGTNPASAQMAGLRVVVVACDNSGNVDRESLQANIETYSNRLAAFMVTYPSTHGVFEEEIQEMNEQVHQAGGLVYVDGANMNAMVGLSSPAQIGGDVCHLNLHKTFCIPHGGGGPGMGPVCVTEELTPFLPADPNQRDLAVSRFAVASTAFGSGSILPISHSYIAMMGAVGLREATQIAILNANYLAKRLEPFYPVLYKGTRGHVAHECIIDLSWLKPIGLTVEDVAKRLMDYGFHAPTVSWPVPFTMMIEPTESENKKELDRFCDAMTSIWHEIQLVVDGIVSADECLLRLAPFTFQDVLQEEWSHPFSRAEAALPAIWSQTNKFWPSVSRVDNAWGDRNFACVCPPMSSYLPDSNISEFGISPLDSSEM